MLVDTKYLKDYENLCPNAIKFLKEHPELKTLEEAMEKIDDKK